MQIKETVSCTVPRTVAPAGTAPQERYGLSILVDHSVVEVFTSTGHCAFIVRVYTEGNAPLCRIFAFSAPCITSQCL